MIKNVPSKWRKLLGLIPGYDPFCMRQEGDWFDDEAADHVVAYYPAMLKHIHAVEGIPSGTPFELQDWQKAVWGALFGFKTSENYRCYKRVFIFVPKRNGKSSWTAGLIPYLLCDETVAKKGMQLFSAASSFEQASIVFKEAVGFIRQNPTLSSCLKIVGQGEGAVKKAIVNEGMLSAYRCLANKVESGDGIAPDFLFLDEVHRYTNDELMTVLLDGAANKSESISIIATTSDFNRISACNDMLKEAKMIRDNGGDESKQGYDPTLLPVIYEASKEDDWTDPLVWAGANPSLGVCKTLKAMKNRCRQAQDIPSQLNSFLRLHLNICTDADVAFIPAEKWNLCGTKPMKDFDLEGKLAYAGIDLSTTQDCTSVVLWFPEDECVLPFFWLPRAAALDRQKKDKLPYDVWERQGLITLVDGNVIDYHLIRKKVNDLNKLYNIQQIAIDRWNAASLVRDLGDDGFDILGFGQGYQSMSDPTKDLERRILDQRINHFGHPVLAWQASNCMVEGDAADNIKLSKKKSTQKIDGMICLVMSLGLSMVCPEPEESAYDTRGVIFI